MSSAVELDPTPGNFRTIDMVGFYCRHHVDKDAASHALYIHTGDSVPTPHIVWSWIRLEQQGWNTEYSCIIEHRQPPGQGIFPVTILLTDPTIHYPEYLRHSWALAPSTFTAAATN